MWFFLYFWAFPSDTFGLNLNQGLNHSNSSMYVFCFCPKIGKNPVFFLKISILHHQHENKHFASPTPWSSHWNMMNVLCHLSPWDTALFAAKVSYLHLKKILPWIRKFSSLEWMNVDLFWTHALLTPWLPVRRHQALYDHWASGTSIWK